MNTDICGVSKLIVYPSYNGTITVTNGKGYEQTKNATNGLAVEFLIPSVPSPARPKYTIENKDANGNVQIKKFINIGFGDTLEVYMKPYCVNSAEDWYMRTNDSHIGVSYNENDGEARITHKYPTNDGKRYGASVDQIVSGGDTITIPYFGVDSRGHVYDAQDKQITIGNLGMKVYHFSKMQLSKSMNLQASSTNFKNGFGELRFIPPMDNGSYVTPDRIVRMQIDKFGNGTTSKTTRNAVVGFDSIITGTVTATVFYDRPTELFEATEISGSLYYI